MKNVKDVMSNLNLIKEKEEQSTENRKCKFNTRILSGMYQNA